MSESNQDPNQEPQSQTAPPQSPPPTDYESWNEGFIAGAEAGRAVENKIWRTKIHFRTFAAAMGGAWCIGMLVGVLGPTVFALLGGPALLTFIFYVLDQTEEMIKGYFKKKEKKDGKDRNPSS